MGIFFVGQKTGCSANFDLIAYLAKFQAMSLLRQHWIFGVQIDSINCSGGFVNAQGRRNETVAVALACLSVQGAIATCLSPWETAVLPLNYARVPNTRFTDSTVGLPKMPIFSGTKQPLLQLTFAAIEVPDVPPTFFSCDCQGRMDDQSRRKILRPFSQPGRGD
jgi:hypothetical protein